MGIRWSIGGPRGKSLWVLHCQHVFVCVNLDALFISDKNLHLWGGEGGALFII